MKKSEFIEELAAKTNSTKAATERFVAAFQETVMEIIDNDDELRLTGFAAFTPSTRAGRIMKNPRTGTEVEIPPIKTVKIRPLRKFRNYLND